ncbi:hypothetical protein PtB15_15B220 [Puccinia triticina]|nr:hypothetical protein PtB15_15B220 [Puccinia triticina]
MISIHLSRGGAGSVQEEEVVGVGAEADDERDALEHGAVPRPDRGGGPPPSQKGVVNTLSDAAARPEQASLCKQGAKERRRRAVCDAIPLLLFEF